MIIDSKGDVCIGSSYFFSKIQRRRESLRAKKRKVARALISYSCHHRHHPLASALYEQEAPPLPVRGVIIRKGSSFSAYVGLSSSNMMRPRHSQTELCYS